MAVFDSNSAPFPAQMTLGRLLGGMPEKTFFDEYWGRKQLRVQRSDASFYCNLFTLQDVDTLLFSSQFRPGEYRIAQSDSGIDLQWRHLEDPDATPPISEFYKQFNAGRSLVLHGLHLRWPAMAVVTRELERAFAAAVTTNVYLTPAGGKAYPLHYDTHDFFIFQLHGSRRWRLYEAQTRIRPVRALAPYATEAFAPGPLIEELELQPGDLLYVPRGYPHEVVSQDSTSLHLTVGLHGMTWYELMANSLAKLAAKSEPLRAFVPLVGSASGPSRHDLSAGPEFIRALCAGLDLRAGEEVWQQQYVAAAGPIPDGQWLALDQARTLSDETPLQRRFGVVHALKLRDGTVELEFLQDKIVRPIEDRPALTYVTAAQRFTVGSIPLASQEARRELAKELILKGFLKLSDFSDPQTGAANADSLHSSQLVSTQGASMISHHENEEHRAAPKRQVQVEPQTGDDARTVPAAGCDCARCTSPAQPDSNPSFVYAIGRISARFPTIDIEKELYQVVRQSETAKLTDSQVLYEVLNRSENAYLAREMCWVFSVLGVETFTVTPRSGLELAELVNALNLAPSAGATNVLIGSRTAGAVSGLCAGLTLPMVYASKIYSFNIDDFVKELPLESQQIAAGKELLDRITHLIDNVGDMDEHRAVNYLSLRHLAMYSLVVENYKRDYSLQGLNVSPVVTRSQRRLVDVTLKFVSRKTDVRELYGVRVDVTGMFPFLVSPLRPVFDKDA